ncbi:MAG: SCP2 sterol-binding domain-containing protein [Candidatus Hodarchaeota archaeon]
MAKFMSAEWLELYKDAINANEAYAKAADWWEGDFVFVISPAGNLKEEIRAFIGLNHGKCTGVKKLEAGEENPDGTEYVYTADYESWVKILKSELDPIRALLSGKASVEGDMAKILKATDAAKELVNSTTQVDTEFY